MARIKKSLPKISASESRKVMTIGEKLKILENETIASVARKFNVNESTIRTIRKNKDKIRQSSSELGTHAQLSKVTRNVNILKMEDMLIIWIQDLIYKKIPLDAKTIRQQALDFYNHLEKNNPTNLEFSASKGWFEPFKNRYLLRSVKFTGMYSQVNFFVKALLFYINLFIVR